MESTTNNNLPDEIRGERILLRSVSHDLATDLVPAYNGDAHFNALSGISTDLTPAAVEADMIESLGMPGGRVWRITRLSDGVLLGVATTALVPPPKNAWIALLIIRAEYQRQGYGTETVRLLEGQFFALPEVSRIGLGVQVTNTGALAFWQSLGYIPGLKRRDQHGSEVITLRNDRPDQTSLQSEITARAQAQFGKTAAAYATSVGHASGSELQEVANIAALAPLEGIALDVATGAGHTAFAIAPYLRQVVASDLTPAMLEEVARGASARGLANVVTVQADVHTLPFEDDFFDLVTVRIAPHHFAALPLALREMVRVTRPGGILLVIDNIVPEDPEVGNFLNHVERLRDPSHLRALTEAEWRQLFEDNHLDIFEIEHYRRRHDYADWVARAQVPSEELPILHAAFLGASEAARAQYQVEIVDGRMVAFTDLKLLIAARKPMR